jgi:hypothetical protein
MSATVRPRLLYPLFVTIVLALASGIALGGVNVATAGSPVEGAIGGGLTYIDMRAGDGKTAPDMTTVSVTNTISGQITFTITYLNRDKFTKKDGVALFLNTDRNTKTGWRGGFDYSVQVSQTESVLAEWAGSRYVPTLGTSPRGRWVDGFQKITFSIADLGNVSDFTFYVESFVFRTGRSAYIFDQVPNGNGVLRYKLGQRSQVILGS